MPKTTLQEIPSATPPKPPRAAKAEAALWPAGVPVVGDLSAGSDAEWLDSTGEDDWANNLICYLWRCEPITDRKSGGAPSSIDKLTKKFDYKEILKLHGSGRYRFDVSYRPKNGGKQTRVRQWYETIFDMSHPPKLPLGDWLEDPRNKDWAWAKTDLEAAERLRILQSQGISTAPAQSKTEELSDLLDIAEKLQPKDSNQALLIALMEQSNPAKMLALAKELAALNQNQQPAAQNSDNPMVLLLLKHLLDREKTATPDPLESTTKLMQGFKGLFEGMGMFPNPGAAAPVKLDTTGLVVQQAGDILGKAIEQFGPYVPAVLEVVRHVKDRDLQIAQVAAARGMNPARPWEYQGNPQNPAPAPLTTAPVTTAAPSAPPEHGPMTPQVFFAKHGALLNQLFPFLKDHFDNQTGYDLADFIISRHGLVGYNTIRQDAKVDLLMQLSSAVPQLAQIFQPPDKARMFFEELLCDPDNRPAEVDEPVEEEQPS